MILPIAQQQLHEMQGFGGIAVSHCTFYLNRKYLVTKPCTSCSCGTLGCIAPLKRHSRHQPDVLQLKNSNELASVPTQIKLRI
ncbi:hypothetical protein SAMN05444143_1211 [Flavobacterium succinicans]|uniref:Uncharacterized protein n=1 Tax=Flavobacterium succinicans TaxID=29536 RepID=A0A1I5A0A4_9FLAO|nr:hypothetical protein SAMN05444143_1211 [Flavobacterium succinicans]